MINKQNLWFLTLFSIILVLSVYYVALPGENLSSLIDNKHSESDKVNTNISENDILATLRVENDETILSEMEDLQSTLLDAKASAEDKNNAYEKLLNINLNKGKESTLESLIHKTYNLKSFIKIKDDKIPYDKWEKRGLVTICEGAKVNYSDVTQWFLKMHHEYDISALWVGYDPWNTQYWVEEMKEQGFEMVEVKQ